MAVSTHVVDVSTATFEQEVLERSREVPVLVDFWAAWCGPCRVLGPVLERVVEALGGAVVLAKVDSDENPELASRYGVRGIPNVQLFRDGEVVDAFVGALPEPQVRQFLARHVTSRGDELVREGREREEVGDREGAAAAYRGALAEEPSSGAARVGLARLALGTGELDAAAAELERVAAADEAWVEAEGLREVLALARRAAAEGDHDTVRSRVEADPDDHAARYALAGHLLARGEHREALDQLLALARRDRRWNDEAARRAMVLVFNLIGTRHPLSDEYRDKLRAVYY